MKYEPYEVHRFFHSKLGAPLPEDYKQKKGEFKAIQLSRPEAHQLREFALHDAEAYFQKGLHSLCEGILDAKQSFFSWAMVKLYYSIFYFLRATAFYYNYALVRWVDMFYVKIEDGATPSNSLLAAYRNDHAFTCALFRLLIKSDDVFNTGLIDEKHPYSWFIEQREYANYRARVFKDPGPWEPWEAFAPLNEAHLAIKIDEFICDAEDRVILPFLVALTSRAYAACVSFIAGVMPPMPMFGRSLL